MPTITIRLTKASIDRLRQEASTHPAAVKGVLLVKDQLNPRLFLRIGPSTAMWRLRLRKGRDSWTWRSLRPWPDLTPEQARREADAYLGEIAEGVDPLPAQKPATVPTWAEYSTAFLDWCSNRPRPVSPATLANYAQQFRDHVLPRWGSVRIDETTRADVQELHITIGKEKPTTANRVLALVKASLNHALDLEIITRNPAQRLKPYRETRRERAFTRAEMARIFSAIAVEEELGKGPAPKREGEAVPGIRGGRGKFEVQSRGISPACASLFRLLAWTGARRREISEALWEWVDLDARVIRIPADRHKTGSRTGQARLIYLDSRGLAEVEKLASIRTGAYLIPGADPAKPLADPKKSWRRVLLRAEVEYAPLHTLRHTWISSMIDAGAAPAMVQRAAGHLRYSTTEAYLHTEEDAVHKEIARVVDLGLAE